MIYLKTPAEIEAMRPAGRLVAEVLAAGKREAKVGMPLTEFDDLANDLLADAGAKPVFLGYQPGNAPVPYPATICTSVNDAVLHGIPTNYRLRDGDLVSLDFGAEIDGWVGDSAISFVVGNAAPADLRLIDAAERALVAGIAAAVVGARIGDVSHAIGAIARAGGYGLNTDYGGHGVGHVMHESPSVPNEAKAGRGLPLQAGMVIAIEPWFMSGGKDSYRIDADGWTIRSGDGSNTAHVEHTVAITEAGPKILTSAGVEAHGGDVGAPRPHTI